MRARRSKSGLMEARIHHCERHLCGPFEEHFHSEKPGSTKGLDIADADLHEWLRARETKRQLKVRTWLRERQRRMQREAEEAERQRPPQFSGLFEPQPKTGH